MTQQRLHSNLASIDVLTRDELSQELAHRLDEAVRTRYLGLELQRIPVNSFIATGSTLQMFTSNDATPWGPEQGDIWMMRRVIVKSSVFTDTARYQLFRGSAPSDVNNAYGPRWLLEGFNTGTPAVSQPAPTTPAVPASGTPVNNPYTFPVSVTVTGGTVTAVSVDGTGLLTGDGTVTVPVGGNVSITYSVAPTWSWANANANVAAIPPGQLCNVGYYPGTKAVFLQPGEQIYAQIQGATATNMYSLDGEAIRCPAEMKGKLL